MCCIKYKRFCLNSCMIYGHICVRMYVYVFVHMCVCVTFESKITSTRAGARVRPRDNNASSSSFVLWIRLAKGPFVPAPRHSAPGRA